MSTSTGSLFLIGGSPFPNQSSTISSGLIHFVLLSFSGPVPLFEAMDMVLLMTENTLHTFKTLTFLP